MEHAKQPLFFPNLNGLRFVGALAVMLFHCMTLNREIWGDFYDSAAFQAVGKVIGRGHLGVNLFFVLSGFLITYLLLDETARKGRINLWRFLMRRFLRVWPLYFVIVLFGFFVFPHTPFGIVTVHEFWRYAVFLSNIDELVNGMRDSINFLTATWTISIEEQFYLTWGLLIAVFAFKKQHSYLWFFGAVIAGSLVFRYFHLGEETTLYFHTFSVMSDLAVGGIVSIWAFNGGAKRFFEHLPRPAILLGYVLGIGFILLEGHVLTGFFAIFERLAIGGVFAFILLEQVYSDRSFYKIDRVPGFFNAGQLTYGFYLFHCIAIFYWAKSFEYLGWTESPGFYLLFVAVVFITTYSAAWLSYRYFELPILRLKRYFQG